MYYTCFLSIVSLCVKDFDYERYLSWLKKILGPK